MIRGRNAKEKCENLLQPFFNGLQQTPNTVPSIISIFFFCLEKSLNIFMFNFCLDNEGSVSQIAAVLAQASHRHKTFDKSLPPLYIFTFF